MTITTSAPVQRPARRAARSVVVWLVVLPGLAWAVLRLGGWEGGPLVQLFAFTPYATVLTLIPVVIALFARRWVAAAVAVVSGALLAVSVLPRLLPDHDRGLATGVELRVMTSNMFEGRADPSRIVQLVRENDVSILALQEYTPAAQDALGAAGLGSLLPFGSLTPEPDTTGSAIYSRFPLSAPGARRNGGGFQQAYATTQPTGAGPLLIESAHPLAPFNLLALKDWRGDLEAEPRADPEGTPRILLGDFNSTLDHAPLRALISHGYRDAADAVGAGLIGTWGPYDGDKIPPVTIDHVLVDQRIGVRDVKVESVAKSDHRAILAWLTIPAAG